MRGEDIDRSLEQLHEHLAATAVLPVDRSASRWLGEAEAVAADALGDDVPDAAIERRVNQVRTLLDQVDGVEHDEANEHVAAARRLATRIATDLDA